MTASAKNYINKSSVCRQRQARIYGMRNKVQYEAKAEDNGIQQ